MEKILKAKLWNYYFPKDNAAAQEYLKKRREKEAMNDKDLVKKIGDKRTQLQNIEMRNEKSNEYNVE